jgi:hypothetical protein
VISITEAGLRACAILFTRGPIYRIAR